MPKSRVLVPVGLRDRRQRNSSSVFCCSSDHLSPALSAACAANLKQGFVNYSTIYQWQHDARRFTPNSIERANNMSVFVTPKGDILAVWEKGKRLTWPRQKPRLFCGRKAPQGTAALTRKGKTGSQLLFLLISAAGRRTERGERAGIPGRSSPMQTALWISAAGRKTGCAEERQRSMDQR